LHAAHDRQGLLTTCCQQGFPTRTQLCPNGKAMGEKGTGPAFRGATVNDNPPPKWIRFCSAIGQVLPATESFHGRFVTEALPVIKGLVDQGRELFVACLGIRRRRGICAVDGMEQLAEGAIQPGQTLD
jgi:hypothetical protein